MKISVCLAVYNGQEFIEAQISSILRQLSDADEVIISDDNSTDDTIKIIKGFYDNRIKIFYNSKQKGIRNNIENALNKASGDFIYLADQDDIWINEKVSIINNKFLDGADLVLSNCSIVDKDLIVKDFSFFEFNKSRKGFMNNLIRNSYIGCCMAVNRKVLDKCLPFPKKIPMHDSWIGLVAEIYFKVEFVEKPLVLYREHLTNQSYSTVGVSKYGFLKKISFRIMLVKAILLNIFEKKYSRK